MAVAGGGTIAAGGTVTAGSAIAITGIVGGTSIAATDLILNSTASGSGGDKPLGTGGTQTASTTIYRSPQGRLDVENPNPGQRPGQIHFQTGQEKYIYDIQTNSFPDAPNRVNDLLGEPRFQAAIQKGMRYLGVGQ